VDEAIEFLEKFAKTIDWTPWEFAGKPLKASSAFVEPVVLTAQEKSREFFSKSNSPKGAPSYGAESRGRRESKRPQLSQSDEQFMMLYERQRQEGYYEESRWSKIVETGIAQRLILLGEPGGGKSCATRYTMAQFATESARQLRLGGAEVLGVVLPLWITATHLLEQPNELNTAEAVIGALERQPELRSKLTDRLRHWLVSRVMEPGCLVTIDGLDELHASRDAKAALFSARIGELGESATSLVVTCRTLPWERLKGLVRWQETGQTVELAPLDERQQREYTKAFFTFAGQSAQASDMEAWLRKEPALRRHARTPLILTFACGLSLGGNLRSGASLRVLYNQMLFSLLEGAWRPNKDGLPAWTHKTVQRERVRLFLGALVWPLFVSSPAVNRFNLAAWTEAWNQAANVKEAPEDKKDHLLEHLCHLGLLVDGGWDETGHPCWSFAHRTVLEFLVADYLVSASPPPEQLSSSEKGWRTHFSTLLRRFFGAQTSLEWLLNERRPFRNAPEWHQVLVFLAELLPQPGRLLNAIGKSIESDGEDVFRSLYSLQKELLCAMPAGPACDQNAENLANAWLERWTTLLLYHEDRVEEPEWPRPLKVPPTVLSSDQFIKTRLLASGCRIAEHPTVAKVIVGSLVDFLQEGKFEEVRKIYVERMRQLDLETDSDVILYVLGASADQFRARVVETLGHLDSSLALDPLIAILKTEQHSESLRSKAALALGNISSTSSIDALVAAVAPGNLSGIREASATALAVMGPDRAVGPLLEALAPYDQNSGRLRLMACNALGLIGSDAAWEGLKAALSRRHDDEDVDGREDMSLSGRQDWELKAEKLLKSAYDRMVPFAAAHALLGINSGKAINALVDGLSSSNDEEVRLLVASVLGESESNRALESLQDALDPRSGNSSQVCAAAARSLGKTGNARCLPLLLATADSPAKNSELVRIAAIEALGELGVDEATLLLSRLLCSADNSVELRKAAANALGKLGSEAAARALHQVPNCPNVEVRTAIFVALSEIASPSSLEYFLSALNPGRHFSVRRVAAEALGKIGSVLAVPALIDALKPQPLTEEDEEAMQWIDMNHMRKQAALALGCIRSENAVTALLVTLDPSYEHRQKVDTRERAYFETVEQPRSIAVQIVCKDWEVRAVTAFALQQISAESSVEKLVSILSANREDHWQVRLWTREALQAICRKHGSVITASPQRPPFQDITTF